MAGYQRFVAYVYEYRKGKKDGSSGYVRVEARDRKCRMEVHLRCVGLEPGSRCRVYGFVRREGLMDGILIGCCVTGQERIECMLETDAGDIGGMGKSLQDLGGMLLISDAGGFWGTEWDDQPIRPENFREWKKEKESESQNKRSRENSESTAEPKIMIAEEVQEEGAAEGSQWLNAEVQEPLQAGDHMGVRPAELGSRLSGTGSERPGMHPPEPGLNQPGMRPPGQNHLGPRPQEPSSSRPGLRPVEPGSNPSGMRPSQSGMNDPGSRPPEPSRPGQPRPEPGSRPPESPRPEPPRPESPRPNPGPRPPELPRSEPPRPNAGPRPLEPPHPEPPRPTPGPRPPESPRPDQPNPTPGPRPPQPSRPGQPNPDPGPRPSRPLPGIPCDVPFNDGQFTDCRKIKPSDCSVLCKQNGCFCNNRFVIYGYQNFGHLLLCRNHRGQYILGVPGGYSQQERFMANMFGFPYFKECPDIHIPGGKGGYWYCFINV